MVRAASLNEEGAKSSLGKQVVAEGMARAKALLRQEEGSMVADQSPGHEWRV